MHRKLGGDLAQANENLVQAAVNVPVDTPEIVALAVALEVSEFGRGATASRPVLSRETFGNRLARNERQAAQAIEQLFAENRLVVIYPIR